MQQRKIETAFDFGILCDKRCVVSADDDMRYTILTTTLVLLALLARKRHRRHLPRYGGSRPEISNRDIGKHEVALRLDRTDVCRLSTTPCTHLGHSQILLLASAEVLPSVYMHLCSSCRS
jgi:hypothetical protein